MEWEHTIVVRGVVDGDGDVTVQDSGRGATTLNLNLNAEQRNSKVSNELFVLKPK